MSARFVWLLAAVAGVHLLGLGWWLQRASAVSGDGGWRPVSAFRVRATVLQEVSTLPQIGLPGETVGAAPTVPRPVRLLRFRSSTRLSTRLSKPLIEPHPESQGERAMPMMSRAGDRTLWWPSPTEYLSDEQVDALPYPKEDWQLAWGQVPATPGAWRVTLRLWVSSQGHIDHVETLEAEPSTAWVVALFESVQQTAMVPATLAGQPVPVTYVVQLAPDQLQ